MLHGLEKFHHYCFARKMCIITDHKPLGAILSMDVATLSQWLQCIMLHIYRYSICIIYIPGLHLYITDRLSKNNHMEDKDQEITGMNRSVNAISTTVKMPVCTSIEAATCEDAHLKKLKSYIRHGWSHKKTN